MNRFFNTEGRFYVIMSRVADLVILNVLTLVCCIPIVTVGAAVTALYDMTLRLAKDEESYLIKSYFKAFRDNFKQATALWLILAAVLFVLAVDFWWAPFFGDPFAGYMRIFLLSMLLIWTMVYIYTFPLQSRFVNRIGRTLQNALVTAMQQLPKTLIMLLLHAIFPVCFLLGPYPFLVALSVYAIIGTALTAYLCSLLMKTILQKYIDAAKKGSE